MPTYVLDGYTFPEADIPTRGPIEEFSPIVWSKQDVVGVADPGTILTAMGTKSPEWDFASRAVTATKDKIVSVYNAQLPVLFKTPENPDSGFSVVITELKIEHRTPLAGSKWLCMFKMMKR